MRRGRVLLEGAVREVTQAEEGARLDDGTIIAEDEALWLPPLVPRTTFAVGLNYPDHAKELSFKPPTEPLLFLKGPNTFCGHRGRTVRPRDVTFMHYECELAVVIGRTARRVSARDGLDYVAGYTAANDYAFRDYLENYYRPNLRVKSRDGATPLGPWLVDRDEVPDPMRLTLRTTVNGRETQRGSTGEMLFGIPWLIEYLTSFLTLEAGDLILTGTPHGLADVRPGDLVVTEVEGVGRLENTIVAEER